MRLFIRKDIFAIPVECPVYAESFTSKKIIILNNIIVIVIVNNIMNISHDN